MKRKLLAFFVGFACFATGLQAQLRADGATASFKGSLPPKPTADISADQQAALEKELAEVTKAFQVVRKHERAADVEIFLKALRYALEFHEWYDKKADDGVKKARALLAEAAQRIESLKKNETPWMMGPGQKVLGFYSDIDNSPQPYGVEVPEGLEWGPGKNAIPMWIWLHGRGDTSTDIHFIASQMKGKGGQFKPKGTIVVHPFGRYCNGWKSAGETDVFECKADAARRFNVDVNRIALAGFSMGGAGAWHLGAHYADQWACVHTGAGFVDVKRYQKITPDKMPPWYEEKLWGVYDVPDYARNFFNVPLISYSGEIDTQRDAAEYMMEVLGKEGLHPPHLIGPGMGHKYHPETIKEVQRLIEEAVAKGRNPMPREVHVQTRSARYGKQFWVQIFELRRSWEDARVDARILDDGTLEVQTKNVRSLHLGNFDSTNVPKKCRIDGVEIKQAAVSTKIGLFWHLARTDAGWDPSPVYSGGGTKGPHDSGPIDDAFLHRFTIVLPDGKSANPAVQQWVETESSHFVQRWRGLMRGDPRVVNASELAKIDGSEVGSLILWGDPASNSEIARRLEAFPIKWDAKRLSIGTQSVDATSNVPVLAYPNAHAQFSNVGYYLVLNSGLTFREAHDKTNSLQNPKLPDWAILDITQPPNAESAGRVVAADFFDEQWQVKAGKSSP